MGLSDRTPVIIGVGQARDRIDDAAYRAWSPSDLAAEAARLAIADAQGAESLRHRIDVVATTRTFEDSIDAPAPFGGSTNFPRSICKRLGINPIDTVWAHAGGNSPQDLVSEFCGRIARGESKVVLLAGSEAISTIRHALATGRSLDFAEDPGGVVEDRGAGIEGLLEPRCVRHGIDNAPSAYALFENARRARLGLGREAYAAAMAALFAPFAAVAHRNPYAAWDVPAFTPSDLISLDSHNRWVADPYPLRLVARDQVNLGAAILICSLGEARALQVPEAKMVFLHGHAHASERSILDRPDLGASEAAKLAARTALERAGTDADGIAAFDFYSCFPIAVFNVACDALGLAPDDPRGLTVTGGLPFFGGPGNNYSMHAIASMVETLRVNHGTRGFIGANGGLLSKYSVGIYSTMPRDWISFDESEPQRSLDGPLDIDVAETFEGSGRIETYTIAYRKGAARAATIVGRAENGLRFIASTEKTDTATVESMRLCDPLHRSVDVRPTAGGENGFSLSS